MLNTMYACSPLTFDVLFTYRMFCFLNNICLIQANESKQIMIAMYNIGIMGSMYGIVMMMIGEDVTVQAHNTESMMRFTTIFLCATITLITLFIPRMIDVAKHRSTDLSHQGLVKGSKGKSGKGVFLYLLWFLDSII